MKNRNVITNGKIKLFMHAIAFVDLIYKNQSQHLCCCSTDLLKYASIMYEYFFLSNTVGINEISPNVSIEVTISILVYRICMLCTQWFC